MNEIIFIVEDDLDGGYNAQALGESIFSEAESLDQLKENIREAVKCHFEPHELPKIIRMHLVRDLVFTP
jgi:hypothetical protein